MSWPEYALGSVVGDWDDDDMSQCEAAYRPFTIPRDSDFNVRCLLGVDHGPERLPVHYADGYEWA